MVLVGLVLVEATKELQHLVLQIRTVQQRLEISSSVRKLDSNFMTAIRQPK